MLNPVYADAIVENMSCTMLHLYGSTLSEYPNVLKQAVETLARQDMRYVYKKGEKVWVGDAAIATDFQIDVMESDIAEVVDPSLPPTPPGVELDTHTYTIEDVVLNVSDERSTVPCRVEIVVVDYEADDAKKDTEDLKYERTIQLVFYVLK
jgi:hypothetical protein